MRPALVALFGVNASMILFGLVQERTGRPGEGRMLLLARLHRPGRGRPWFAIGIYLVSPGLAASPPAFVYGIFVSLFAFFNVFALNMWLQYRRIGPGETTCSASLSTSCSLAAKSRPRLAGLLPNPHELNPRGASR